MKNNTISKYLSHKFIFFYFILGQCVFTIFYNLFIKEKLLDKIKYFDDPEDSLFYHKIFANLEFAIIIVTILLVLLFFLRKIIFNLINQTDFKKIIVFSLLTSFIIQILIVVFVKTELLADSIYYSKVSESFFNTGEYYSDDGFKSSFWPIGLPLIMAGLKHIYSDNILLIRILNIFVNLGLILISYLFFKDQLNNQQKKYFFIIFAFLPSILFGPNSILTEIYFTFFLYVSLFFITRADLKYYHYIFSGLFIGLSAYMRPVGLILPIVFLIYFYLTKNFNFFRIILLFGTFLLIISPWMIRNYLVFNSFVPMSTNGGLNFLIGNNESSWGKINFNFEYNSANSNEVEESNLAYKKGWEAIKKNPVKSILRLPAKIFFTYWRGDSYFIWSFKKTGNEINPLLLSILFYFVNLTFYTLVIFSIISYFKHRKEIKDLIELINMLIMLFVILILIYVGSDRYILSLIPIKLYFVVNNLDKSVSNKYFN